MIIFAHDFLSLSLVLTLLVILIKLQILNLAHNKSEIERRVHAVIDKFAERGLRSLAVAYQVGISLAQLFICFYFFWCSCR